VRAVDITVALRHDDARFIRPVDAARAEHRLPAMLDATGRGEHVVPARVLVQLRPFQRAVARQRVAIDDDLAGAVEQAAPVRRHAAQRQHIVEAGPALGPGMDQVSLAVVIPQRGRVDDALAGQEQVRRAPGTGEILGRDHEHALVRVGIEDPEAAIVVAQAGRPYALARLG